MNILANYDVAKINSLLKEDCEKYIMECENAYRKQLDTVVDEINTEKGRVLVMLAGPSSSGKTTTAKLISEKLSSLGRSTLVVSLDDFYLAQDIPRTFEDGTVDYETVEALDIKLITSCLRELITKGESMMPRFCFKSKKRSGTEKVTVEADAVIIVEGLHAINPVITEPLKNEKMKKYYVNVSSRITEDGEVLFLKRDLRFIRRLIRDFYHRSSEVEYTFYLWNGVRMGEDRYLFPYSSLADRKIDSIHPYEVGLFKNVAMTLLDRVGEESIYYENARQLKRKLDSFVSVDKTLMPENSLLGEFIG